MKLENFIKKWYNKKIEDCGSYTSQEYEQFQKEYKSVLKDMCKNIDFALYSFSKNHYEFSAVVQSNISKNFFYISISDVRYWNNEWADNILYRTMEHSTDWRGGYNRYCTLASLQNALKNIDVI